MSAATTPNGGPAFPGVSADGRDEHVGMSLRDYFAAAAMSGLCARMNADDYIDLKQQVRAGGYEARVAYTLADAMLAERSK
jgi:hypothetical protein